MTSTTTVRRPIAELVPHQGAMCLLDSLLEADDESLVAEVTPSPDDLFADTRGIPGWVGIEWLAQAIAAWSGTRAVASGDEPRIGFLLGSRRYRCSVEHFPFDHPVRVVIALNYIADNGLGAFSGQLLDAAGVELANATLSVFEPDGPEALATLQQDSSS